MDRTPAPRRPAWGTRPWHSWPRYILSLPERTARAGVAGLGGTVHEGAQLLLPRLVRRSRLYEVTARNALRIAIELVGGVQGAGPGAAGADVGAGRVAVKKAAGNVVELGSIAAFGFSPLWLLAGAADVLNGSRTYLRALEAELIAHGYLPPHAQFASVEQLLNSLQGATGTAALLIDLPPIEVAEVRRVLAELREDASTLPSPPEMAALFDGLRRAARAEQRSLLSVSSGVGMAILASARNVGREQVATPYREDWAQLHREGVARYAARVSGPYRRAITGHFDPSRPTHTGRLPAYSVAALRWLRRLPGRRQR